MLCTVFSHVRRQYHLVYNLQRNMTEALKHCREQYTDLATIENMEDVKAVNDLINIHWSSLPWVNSLSNSIICLSFISKPFLTMIKEMGARECKGFTYVYCTAALFCTHSDCCTKSGCNGKKTLI